MVFSSYIFLLAFLPATLLGFYSLRRFGAFNASVTFLLCASFVFYAYWSLPHSGLLLGAILVNFIAGRSIGALSDRRHAKLVMIAAIVFNLGLIFIFKYLDFTGTVLAQLTGNEWRFLSLLLPLGISFFTFQQIAYIVDCYKHGSASRTFRDYALFVSFFPQLIAGPIVHHAHTRPQFADIAKRPINTELLPYGLVIFAMGLMKKTMIADPIARIVDPLFAAAANGEMLTTALSLTAMIGYSLQIYFDFSGYCDMAIGLGLMFGIRLPVNFNSPYKSRSIIEFWRRWHITLSNFLRDYVYIPFGGNRGSSLFRLRNIFLTMLIGGIWHGAAWTFIVWGALHATFITLNHAMRLYAPSIDRWNDTASIVLKRTGTLSFVVGAWVFFRADDLPTAMSVFSGLTNVSAAGTVSMPDMAIIIFAAALALFAPNSLEVAGYISDPALPFPSRQKSRPLKTIQLTPLSASATAIMLSCGAALAWKPAAFIYFNF